MRVLFATDFVPSPEAPHTGGKLIFHYAAGGRMRGGAAGFLCVARPHERELATALRTTDEFPLYPAYADRGLLRRARRLMFSLAHPLAYAFVRSVDLQRAAVHALRDFRPDVIHAVQPHVFEAVSQAAASLSLRPVRVAHAIDVIAKLHLRNLLRPTQHHLSRWWTVREAVLGIPRELRLYATADAVVCHTESDRAFLRSFVPAHTPVFMLPVWFDAAGQVLPHLLPERGNDNEAYDLLYVGNGHDPRTREALDWFLGDIYPRICHRRPGTTLAITGMRRVSDRARWCCLSTVHCYDYVENLIALYDRSRVLIAPLRTGGGIHIKVINAFARGCPVVMTSVANDGIAARPGQEAMIADDAASFAAAVLRLLDDPALRLELATRALAWLRRYTADDTAQLWEEVYPAVRARLARDDISFGV
ncbi:glycosyltransferase [Candidatus Roseilinea sp. NK_OTU-006]|jgi:glycosyltransferase involved in cell wall biosynthesis|uniref:glycosyltransferase n=1 Tax=Candidatus Roseilinea sp. NK_OTU-006 TaxID=2704250 RepID=UPI00145E45BA|nr:glycosyltransferase [Candidatus Roseilinea sp. NK_OTU-006]